MNRKKDNPMYARDGTRYKYPSRSCKMCKNEPCFIGKESCICDFAKYGCNLYKRV